MCRVLLCIGSCDEFFSVEIHHLGFFCGIGKNMTYLNEKVDWFDYCSNDTWSLLYVEDFLKLLDIIFPGYVRVYWCFPNKSLAEGLKPLNCDAHIVVMNNVSKSEKNILVYVDHHSLLE